MRAGRDPLPQPFCLRPHLSSSARVCSFPSGCVCTSVFLGSVISSLPPCVFMLPPTRLPPCRSLGVCVRLRRTPCPSFFAPVSLSAPVSSSPLLILLFLALGLSTTFPPVCRPPTPVSLHPLPRLSPHTLLPRPKETVGPELGTTREGPSPHPHRPLYLPNVLHAGRWGRGTPTSGG